jgi:hypothetical protein
MKMNQKMIILEKLNPTLAFTKIRKSGFWKIPCVQSVQSIPRADYIIVIPNSNHVVDCIGNLPSSSHNLHTPEYVLSYCHEYSFPCSMKLNFWLVSCRTW